MQLLRALFHSIQGTINPLQDFKNTTKIPTANMLEKEDKLPSYLSEES